MSAIGLYGKLPSRGDFVRLGLTRDFTDPWDAWWQRGLAFAEDRAGSDWLSAWLEAPVWQFALPAGMCGQAGVLGVFLPSVDAVGRHFPLTLACLSPPGWDEAFLRTAEDAGREAIASDLAPGAVLERLRQPADAAVLAPQCRFRTEGGPRVAPRDEGHSGLPAPETLAGMLDDAWRDPAP